MPITPGPLLQPIQSPQDLKKLSVAMLPALSSELRQYLIDTISVYGGHFAANLGVVELTVALHYVLNTPYDKLVWDVGHQAYAHKILTGRRDNFHTNRLLGGVSGFPKMAESEYDTFGTGHSSTSISAIVGMAAAGKLLAENRSYVAVIGDGALTGGLAFEGLNHAGALQSDVLIVLNDNSISIDANTVAIREYKNYFESLKINYYGSVDGHDVQQLVSVLTELKTVKGPKLLHCLTTKGKGFEPAEKEQTKWHAPGVFDKISGQIEKKIHNQPKPPKYQDVFGHTLLELAKLNPKIVGITPAMPSGSSMNILMDALPDRAFDVGIAEQHAVTFSAGLATQGLVPFCNIYSTFMQRAYDQVIHDVCVQNLPMVFCLDRAGLAGADGPTHHGAFDLAFMRCLPNMIVAAPMNEEELRNLMYTAQLNPQRPFTIRYPRGNGVMADWQTPFTAVEIGKGRMLQEGSDVAVLTVGTAGNLAQAAIARLAGKLSVAHYDMRFVKPIDEALLHQVAKKFNKIVTAEDGCLAGGFGSVVLEFFADNGYTPKVKRLGIPDNFIEQGEQEELYKICGYDEDSIEKAILEIVK
ncbi:MAG: 1-deoxy-D-xylulose-5-phosphate synthase [Bacteroidetes bacterium]|nr:MAG: 1-deoxy-D-xylulose-5-phosphate synthase [Bacteroidota bacterium]